MSAAERGIRVVEGPVTKKRHIASTVVIGPAGDKVWISTIRLPHGYLKHTNETLVFEIPPGTALREDYDGNKSFSGYFKLNETQQPEFAPFNLTNMRTARGARAHHNAAVRKVTEVLNQR